MATYEVAVCDKTVFLVDADSPGDAVTKALHYRYDHVLRVSEETVETTVRQVS